MNQIPFAISKEAAGCIEKVLIESQRRPQLLACVASLVCTFGAPTSRVVVGWYGPKQIAEGGFSEFDLFGFKLVIHESSLKRLIGNEIVLGYSGLCLRPIKQDPDAAVAKR